MHQNRKYTRTDWDNWTWRPNSLSQCWLVWQLCWRSSKEKVYWLVTDWQTNAKILPLHCGCWIAVSVLGEHIFWPLILLLLTLFGRMVCAWLHTCSMLETKFERHLQIHAFVLFSHIESPTVCGAEIVFCVQLLWQLAMQRSIQRAHTLSLQGYNTMRR